MGKYEIVKSSDHEDKALIARILESDGAEGIGELYTKHYRRIYGLCMRILNNIDDAEDMTQNAFLHMLVKLKTFKGESAFTTWMHRLVVNLCLMKLRTEKRSKEKVTDDGEFPDGPDPRHKPSQYTDSIIIKRALERLPPGYLQAFILHDIEGYEHEEIATILGTSSGTSKSQLHKARLRLAKFITLENDKRREDDMARPPGPITEVINQYLRDHGIKVANIKLEKIDKIANAIARFSVRSGKQFGLKDIRRKLGLMRSHAIQKNKTASVSKIASTPSPVVDAPKKATPAPPVGAYLWPQVTLPLLSNYTEEKPDVATTPEPEILEDHQQTTDEGMMAPADTETSEPTPPKSKPATPLLSNYTETKFDITTAPEPESSTPHDTDEPVPSATAAEPEVSEDDNQTTDEDSLVDEIQKYIDEIRALWIRQRDISWKLEAALKLVKGAFKDQAKLRRILELTKDIE